MFVIKRNYYNKSKEILKDMNKLYYGFSHIKVIHNIDNTFTLKLNDNNKTEYFIINGNYLIEILNACLGIKCIDFDLQLYIKESLLK